MEEECEVCRQERRSKALAALGPDDLRFREEKFVRAIAIFSNNDIKYDMNKTRAALHAESNRLEVVYSVAQDDPSAAAKRECPTIAARKREWLQRHDRECGDLYGMLQLTVRMPVAMTDHIDRSPDKLILRGRIGFVHSWVLDDGETSVVRDGVRILKKLPKVVFVKFPGAKWKLPSCGEAGVYPVVPKKADWFLDAKR